MCEHFSRMFFICVFALLICYSTQELDSVNPVIAKEENGVNFIYFFGSPSNSKQIRSVREILRNDIDEMDRITNVKPVIRYLVSPALRNALVNDEMNQELDSVNPVIAKEENGVNFIYFFGSPSNSKQIRSVREILRNDIDEMDRITNVKPVIRYLVSPALRNALVNDEMNQSSPSHSHNVLLQRKRRRASPTYKKSYPSSGGGGCCNTCGQCGGGCRGGGCGGGGGQSGSYSQSTSYSSSSSGSYNSKGKKK